MNRDRFPGLADGWARLDGPAGTQMVDVAIEAMADWMRSGRNANHGGAFAAARATDAVPIAPLAPVRFTTTNCWPSLPASPTTSARAPASTRPLPRRPRTKPSLGSSP